MDSADSHWIPPPCIPCAPFTHINLMQGFCMTQTSASHISISQSGGTLWSHVKAWATSRFNISMLKWKTHDTNLWCHKAPALPAWQLSLGTHLLEQLRSHHIISCSNLEPPPLQPRQHILMVDCMQGGAESTVHLRHYWFTLAGISRRPFQESLQGDPSVTCPAWTGMSVAVGLRLGLTADQCVCECVEGWGG